MVRTGPVIGLFAQLALLAVLYTTVGLDALGWFAGITYGVVVCCTLTFGLVQSGAAELTPADRVTLIRATLVGGVTALIASGDVPTATMVTLTAVALALDAVDGKVARRTGKITALGARFDMEVDAFLILVLSVFVVPLVGGWVLAIGLMRYAFVAASWVLPWMRGSLPPRLWRKVVAATQGIVLAVAAADVLPSSVATIAVATSLALLAESFARDVLWLWRHRVAVLLDQIFRIEPQIRQGALASAGSASIYEVGKVSVPAQTIVDGPVPTLEMVLTDPPSALICQVATTLDRTRDPFDQLISAQSVATATTLVTRDRVIREHLPLAWWTD